MLRRFCRRQWREEPCSSSRGGHRPAGAAVASPKLFAVDRRSKKHLSLTFLRFSPCSRRHRYSQYLTAQVLGSDGREIRTTKSSFQHCLRSLKWLPAYRPLEGDQVERSYLLPSSVYLSSRDVHSLLGNHVCYVDISPCQFSMELGKTPAVLEISAACSRCILNE